MLDQQTTPVEIAEIAREMKLASPEVAATPAETRNAIHLLKLIGFDQSIIDAAHNRADHYAKTGKWM